MRVLPQKTIKTTTIADLIDEKSAISLLLTRPPVVWSALALVCSLSVYAVGQTDIAERKIASLYNGNSTVRMASAPNQQTSPYSVDLALLQNEVERARAEVRNVYAAKQSLEQKMALLETKFSDITGSIEAPVAAKSKSIAEIAKPALIQQPQQELATLPTSDVPVKGIPNAAAKPEELLSTPVQAAMQMQDKKEIKSEVVQQGIVTQPIAQNTSIAALNITDTRTVTIQKTNDIKPEITSKSEPKLMSLATNGVPIPPVKPAEKMENAAPALSSKDAFAKEVNLITGSIEPKPSMSISTPTRTLFAVRVGDDKTMTDARTRWQGIIKKNESILAGMEPYVNLDEQNKSTKLHLLVGPFRNAQEATNICGQLSQNGTPCTVSVFNGQRLDQ